MILLKVEQRKTGWYFTVLNGDTIIAKVNAEPMGTTAVLHNEIYLYTPKLARIYKHIFMDIKGYLKNFGMTHVMPISQHHTKKIEKFWRLMGFKFFGEHLGCHYAMMET